MDTAAPSRRRSRVGVLVAGLVALTALVVGASPASAAALHQNKVVGGKTTLVTAPGIVDALVGAGVSAAFAPKLDYRVSTVGGKTVVRNSFQVTGGRLEGGAGTVNHTGGITFSRGDASLKVGRFSVVLGDTPQLTAAVNNSSTRVPVFDLDLSGAKVVTEDGVVKLFGVTANLTGAAAGALNDTLGTTLFAEGLTFGTVRSIVVVAS